MDRRNRKVSLNKCKPVFLALDALTPNNPMPHCKSIHPPFLPTRRLRTITSTCIDCTPKLSSALTCILCRKTKPSSEFSKTQRRNYEKARCLKCIEAYHDEDENAGTDDEYTDEEDKRERDKSEFLNTYADII
ncbi:hypothetical protein BC937DRAFT_94459 [Endogone sp. FLAS-F59071]|nr:hypothetical protein BC937DRAFT_94459 [Endogone sp. FLAS-F59071]|eukprot:RUS14024.1 hypothetical protein BC937DRAFT_94459 [Endogone sp. FLAS-F59071]